MSTSESVSPLSTSSNTNAPFNPFDPKYYSRLRNAPPTETEKEKNENPEVQNIERVNEAHHIARNVLIALKDDGAEALKKDPDKRTQQEQEKIKMGAWANRVLADHKNPYTVKLLIEMGEKWWTDPDPKGRTRDEQGILGVLKEAEKQYHDHQSNTELEAYAQQEDTQRVMQQFDQFFNPKYDPKQVEQLFNGIISANTLNISAASNPSFSGFGSNGLSRSSQQPFAGSGAQAFFNNKPVFTSPQFNTGFQPNNEFAKLFKLDNLFKSGPFADPELASFFDNRQLNNQDEFLNIIREILG